MYLALCSESEIRNIANIFGDNHIMLKKSIILHGNYMYDAVQNGYIDCIKYLIDTGTEIDPEITYIASRDGNLPMLKYAVNQGVQCTRMDLLISTLANRPDCIEYLREIGCPEI
jgi:hypothetical protein